MEECTHHDAPGKSLAVGVGSLLPPWVLKIDLRLEWQVILPSKHLASPNSIFGDVETWNLRVVQKISRVAL